MRTSRRNPGNRIRTIAILLAFNAAFIWLGLRPTAAACPKTDWPSQVQKDIAEREYDVT